MRGRIEWSWRIGRHTRRPARRGSPTRTPWRGRSVILVDTGTVTLPPAGLHVVCLRLRALLWGGLGRRWVRLVRKPPCARDRHLLHMQLMQHAADEQPASGVPAHPSCCCTCSPAEHGVRAPAHTAVGDRQSESEAGVHRMGSEDWACLRQCWRSLLDGHQPADQVAMFVQLLPHQPTVTTCNTPAAPADCHNTQHTCRINRLSTLSR